jgi:hypothetical protein
MKEVVININVKNMLSIRVSTLSAYITPKNNLYFFFEPQSHPPERLYGVKITKIEAIESLTLGHL